MKRSFLALILFFICMPLSYATQESPDIIYSLPSSYASVESSSLWSRADKNWKALSNADYKDSLGWLYAADDMLVAAPALEKLASELKADYDYIVLLGMGGSALPAAALKAAASAKRGYPELIVLDTSNPDTFLRTEKEVKIARTLFIVSSKSGTTVETMSAYKYFWQKVYAAKGENAGQNFIAVTDKATPLYEEAQNKKFLRVFENRKDMGGAFVAVSYSFVLPAAIAGYDVEKILTAVKDYQVYLKKDFTLPSVLSETLAQTSSRVFFVADKKFQPLCVWIGEILSESFGKQGLGVAPIITEKLDKTLLTPSDLVVYIGAKEKKAELVCPSFYLKAKNEQDIAKQFILWQFAAFSTAVNLDLEPFKQPDSGLSKKMTAKILKDGVIPVEFAFSKVLNGLAVSVPQMLKDNSADADYIALLVYADADKANVSAVKKFADTLQEKLHKPVIVACGPAYQHTLGQFFKGGKNKGLFVIIGAVKNDLPLDNGDNVKTLILSQAYGDFLALEETGRKAAYVNLNIPVQDYLKTLSANF